MSGKRRPRAHANAGSGNRRIRFPLPAA